MHGSSSFIRRYPSIGSPSSLNKDENIEVGKVSGSLSKGFQIAEIEFSAKPGQVSLLKDVRILYPDLIKGLRKNEFNIKEIGVASARMYVDFNSKDGEGSLQINGGGSDSDKDSKIPPSDSDVSSEGVLSNASILVV